MSSNFEEFIRQEMPLRQVLLYQPGDPRVAPGYTAVIGAYYLDTTDNYTRYVKLSAGDMDWAPVGNGDVGTMTISALSAAIDSNRFDIQSLSGVLSAHVYETNTTFDTLSTQLTSYIQSNDTSLHTLSSTVENNNTSIEQLSGSITNNTSITNINTSLSALSAQIAGLSATSTENITNLVDIDTRLAQFESTTGSVDTISDITIQLSTDLDALSGTPVSCFDSRTYRAAKYVVHASNPYTYMTFEVLLSYYNTTRQGRGITHVVYAVMGDNQLVSTTSCLIGDSAVMMFTPSEPDVIVNVQRSLISEQFPTIAYCGTPNIPTTRTDIITLHGPGGVFKHYAGESGMSLQTDMGSAIIAVDDIVLGGAPWHFRISLDNQTVALITIPAEQESMLSYCKVYVKIGQILYAGTPDITTGEVVLEQQNKPAPVCPPEEQAILLQPCDPEDDTNTTPTGGGGTNTTPTSGGGTSTIWMDSNFWDDSNYWSEQ